jgi:hypothetical protein
MKYYFMMGFLVIQAAGYSQLTRREIIEKKILSVERTTYNKSGTKMNAQKNYFSLKGSDSLELNNNEAQFRFKQELDASERVSQLKRYDTKGNNDELHVYEYGDTSYTIEIIAQGAGTIYFSTYNNKHDQLEEIQSSIDTFYYSNNELGKVGKISQKEGGELKDVVVTEFDAKGFPAVMRLTDGSLYFTRLVYSDQGLPAEARRIKLNGSQEQLVLRTVFTYEFRKN